MKLEKDGFVVPVSDMKLFAAVATLALVNGLVKFTVNKERLNALLKEYDRLRPDVVRPDGMDYMAAKDAATRGMYEKEAGG
jgi:hypothetical protein